MKIGLEFRNELSGIIGGFWIVEQFDRMIAAISGLWKRQHLDNGRHGDVTATDVQTPSLAVFSEASLARAYTDRASTVMASASATTLFSLPGAGLYLVFASILDAGSANYAASAVVRADGTDASLTATNGALLTLTLSGTNVQATQSSGASASVFWTYFRIL